MCKELKFRPNTQSFLKLLWKAIELVIYIAAAIGALSGILALINPSISISQTTPLNPTDPFSAFFIVSNDDTLTINSVSFDCVIHNLTSSELNVSDSDFEDHNYDLDVLEPGEKTSIKCPLDAAITFAVPPNYDNVDIVLAVRFRVAFLPWFEYRTYRFVIEHGSDGSLSWYPQPNSALIIEPLLQHFIKTGQ
jgi:hypothetical protein